MIYDHTATRIDELRSSAPLTLPVFPVSYNSLVCRECWAAPNLKKLISYSPQPTVTSGDDLL